MKKKIIVCLFSVLLFFIITSPFLIIPLLNNIHVGKIESKLKNVPLLEKTELIQSKSIVGKLNGNGNGVDYLITVVIKSEQSLGSLKDYYQSYNKDSDVIEQKSDQFENALLEHGKLSYRDLKGIRDLSGYYTVYIYDSAEFGSILEWDFRGH